MTKKELEKKIASLEFKMELWSKVRIKGRGDDGNNYANATLDNSDPLFRYLTVSGYNEATGEFEKDTLPCWFYPGSDWTKQDLREWYEETGESPVLSPAVMMDFISTHIHNLEMEIREDKKLLDELNR